MIMLRFFTALACAALSGAAALRTDGAALFLDLEGSPHHHMSIQGGHAEATARLVPGASIYRGVYPGIDVKYYKRMNRSENFEYDFIVAPGADPSRIRLGFPNSSRIEIDEAGDLLVHSARLTVRHRRPYSYQMRSGREIEVPSAFRITGSAVTFDLGEYDRGAELVIDPEVIYSTPVTACCLQALGADGSAYHATWGQSAVFQKLSPAGQSQYVLPLNSAQQIVGVAVDSAGALYANGVVNPAIPPPLVNAVRTTPAASFLVKVLPDGSGVAFVTYYEGPQGPMTVAADGSIFVASKFGAPAVVKIAATGAVVWTHSPNFSGAGISFTDIAVEGSSVFAGGATGPNLTALARLGSGSDPAASAYTRTWTLSDTGGLGVLVEPDGAGGVFALRSRNSGCAAVATLTRLDGSGNETASTPVPFEPVPCGQFTDSESGVGPRALARAANGDVWVGGVEGLLSAPGLSRAFARRYPASLGAPSFTAATSQPREPLIISRGIQSFDIDATGAIFTASNAVLSGGFLARKTSMTNASPVGTPGAPTAAQPSSGQSAVAVSWQAAPGATGYRVSVMQTPFGAYSVVQDVTGGASTSVLLPLAQTVQTGLYSVSVRACLGGFGDASCGESASTVAEVTLRPVILAPAPFATLTSSTVTFSWENVPVFTSYMLNVSRDGQQIFADTYSAPLTRAFYSLPSGNYFLRLRGFASSGFSFEVSRNFTVQLPSVPASSPAIQSAVVSGGNSVTVTFPTVAGADLYLVQVIQPNTGPGGGALTVAARVVSASPVTLQVPAGQAGVVVSACNGDGCAPHATAITINPTGPNPPAPVIASPAAGSYVTGPVVFFSWSRIPGDNGSNTTYRLYIQDMERQAPSGNIYTTQNFWALRLQPGKRYDAIVLAAVNGQSVQSAVANFVLSGPVVTSPTPVFPGYQETNAPRRHDGSIALAWAPVPGASAYQWVLNPPTGSPIVSAVEFTDARGVFGLAPGAYTGKVRACFSVSLCAANSDTGWGPWSDAAGTGPWVFTLP